MEIILRNGDRAEFDRNRITRAIKKALEACDMPSDVIALSVTEDVVSSIGIVESVDQEAVQDLIEDMLMKRGLWKVAKAFIKYRDRHAMIRNSNTELVNGVMDRLSAKAVTKNNANVDECSFGGRTGEAISYVTKRLALDFKMSEISKNNHENNTVYIHDLDQWIVGSHNCLSIPFDKLLKYGFVTRQTDVRGAQSISTAFQLMAVIFQLQSLQQFGGVSSTHLDFTMVPFVRKSFRKHYLRRALEEYMNDRILQDKEPSKEMDSILWRFPSKQTWYSVDDEHLEQIEKTFNQWYMEVMDITDADFKFYSTKLNATLRTYAMQDTRKEAYQAVEAFIHNLNTLQSRSGNQLPFTSINVGTCTEPEGRMITELLLKGYMAGTGKKSSTPRFPCFIFVSKKGINRRQGDPNYDLFQKAIECTAKRIYPNYGNGDWSSQRQWLQMDRDMKREIIDSLPEDDQQKLLTLVSDNPELGYKLTLLVKDGKLDIDPTERPYEQFSTMGCRTANGFDVNAASCYRQAVQEALEIGEVTTDLLSGAQKDGRGNICPVTIILPELAMIANGDEDTFMQLLDQKIHEAKDTLLERFNWICSQPASSAVFMYDNHTMCGYREAEGIRSALQHGTIVIGQVGLAETLQILIGKDHTTTEGMELAKKIEGLFAERCTEFKKQYHLNFGVYYSPAESLCHTALVKFREKYGVIPNVSDKEFFTNSMHVPVWIRMNPFEKADIESQLTGYSSAGCISYYEFDIGIRNNPEALEKLILYTMEKDIPYVGGNTPNDHCEACGYLGEIPDKCPKCGSTDIVRLRRVTGYISVDYHQFNIGKQDEVEHRRKHIG